MNLFFKSLILFGLIANIIATSPDDDRRDYLKKIDTEKVNIKENEKIKWRLNDNTKPSYYDVTLDLTKADNEDTFDGEIKVNFVAKVATDMIVLNQEMIEIDDKSVVVYDESDDDKENLFKEIKLVNEFQKVEIHLNEPLDITKNYKLELKYTGHMGSEKEMRGLYRSYYIKKDGDTTKKQYLFTTQFGQVARRMLPCWDEPRFKAQFEFHIIYRNDHKNGIANTLQNAPTTSPDTHHYKPTSLISTYILALVYSDFVNKESDDKKFEVVAREEAIEQATYAVEVGPKIIKAFDDWTDLPYYDFVGVEKMSMAAVPDFSAGAMENWGLLIHREVNLLYDEKYATSLQKQRIALVTSHEIAHMWFGDLVTCDWFDATWLNEGFARYFQYIGVDAADDTLKVMDQFTTTTLHQALASDQTPSAHPLTNTEIYDYPEIRTMFSTITYDKGASILRMAQSVMGDDNFKQAIQNYLKKHEYDTAVPDDLLFEMEALHKGIIDILGPFTLKAGFPLVTVTRDGDKFTFTQKRFFINPTNITDTDKTRWTIPISIATEASDFDKVITYHIFEEHKDNLEVTLNSTLNYFIVNINQMGFYRVNYDESNWNAIGAALKQENFGGIPVLTRAQIIDDLFNIARAGHLNYKLVFSILEYMDRETDLRPWSAFFSGISYLQSRMSDDAYKKKNKFDEFVLNKMRPIYQKSSFENTPNDHLEKLNMINIMNWACKYGESGCVAKAKEEFEKFIKEENIKSDWKPAVYCTGYRESEEKWGNMWSAYNKTNFATEQATLLTAMGCTKNEKDLTSFMDQILHDGIGIRYQDKSAAYSSAYTGNLENIDIVFNYIKNNTARWKEQMDIVSTLGDLSSRFTRESQFDELEKLDSGLTTEEKQKLKEISEKNRENLNWDKTRLLEIGEYFNAASFTKNSLLVMLASLIVAFLRY